LSIINDSLSLLQIWNEQSYKLVLSSGNTYTRPAGETRFIFSNLTDGSTQTLNILQSDGNDLVATRKKEINTSGVDFNKYIGSYFSKELDVTYHITMENETLKLRIEDSQETIDGNLSDIDQFALEIGLIRFQISNGVVAGFELDSGRVKNLKFERK